MYNITPQLYHATIPTPVPQIAITLPSLPALQVGDRPDSNVYIGAKVKACREIGITGVHVKLSPETSQEELLEKIEQLNEDPSVNGIILQVGIRADIY